MPAEAASRAGVHAGCGAAVRVGLRKRPSGPRAICLTAFGRQNEGRQSEGLPIGSYSAWARAGRMSWWKGHQNRPVLAQDLDLALQRLIDPNSAEPRLSSIWRWLTRHEEMRAGERAAVSGRSRSDELSASCNLSFNKGRKSGSISGRASQSVFSRPAPKHTSREWRKTAKRAECGSVECR